MSTIAAQEPKRAPAIPNYRKTVRAELPEGFFERDASCLLWLIPHAAIIGGGIWLLAAHFSWWLAPFISIVIGHSFACMGFLGHEVAHGAVLKRGTLREATTTVLFSPFWIGATLWHKWHTASHHSNTQIAGEDPDHLFTMEHYEKSVVLHALYRLSPLARNLVIFSSFSYRMTQQTIRMFIHFMAEPKTTAYERMVLVAQMFGPIVAWVGITWWIAPAALFWGYLIPMLVANTIAISYIVTNHFLNPLADHNDVLASSLTVTLPKGFKWLDPWHAYFGAHVAHHLFPMVPAKNARAVEAKIEELYPDRYHAMPITKALRLLWQTPWVYDRNETHLVDPHRGQRDPTLGHGLESRK